MENRGSGVDVGIFSGLAKRVRGKNPADCGPHGGIHL